MEERERERVKRRQDSDSAAERGLVVCVRRALSLSLAFMHIATNAVVCGIIWLQRARLRPRGAPGAKFQLSHTTEMPHAPTMALSLVRTHSQILIHILYAVALLSLFFFYNFFLTVSPSPFRPFVSKDFSLSLARK